MTNRTVADAQWLREQSENLVRYEEDAQRLRRIAGYIGPLVAALRLFIDDERFQVTIGGNPIAVEAAIEQAHAALALAAATGTASQSGPKATPNLEAEYPTEEME